jgi:hypothetical protein
VGTGVVGTGVVGTGVVGTGVVGTGVVGTGVVGAGEVVGTDEVVGAGLADAEVEVTRAGELLVPLVGVVAGTEPGAEREAVGLRPAPPDRLTAGPRPATGGASSALRIGGRPPMLASPCFGGCAIALGLAPLLAWAADGDSSDSAGGAGHLAVPHATNTLDPAD